MDPAAHPLKLRLREWFVIVLIVVLLAVSLVLQAAPYLTPTPVTGAPPVGASPVVPPSTDHGR